MIHEMPFVPPRKLANPQDRHYAPIIPFDSGCVRSATNPEYSFRPAELFLDSGADVTVVGRYFFRLAWQCQLPPANEPFPIDVRLRDDCDPIRIETAFIQSIEHPKPGPEDILLGRDFLAQFLLILDGPAKTFSVIDVNCAEGISPRAHGVREAIRRRI